MTFRVLTVLFFLSAAACEQQSNEACGEIAGATEQANSGSARARLRLAQHLAEGSCIEQSGMEALMWLKLIQTNPLRAGEFVNDGDSIGVANQEMGEFLFAVEELDSHLRAELSASDIADAEQRASTWVTPEYARLKALVESGDRDAQFDFAKLHFAYDSGLKYDDGIPYLEMAAEQGQPNAAYMMGKRYSDKQLPIEDPVRAFEWYRVATEAGHYLGRNALLLSYCEGRGVPQDNVECYKWLAIHYSRRPDFPDNLEPYWQQTLIKKLTDEQMRRAEAAANEWVAAHPDADYGT